MFSQDLSEEMFKELLESKFPYNIVQHEKDMARSQQARLVLTLKDPEKEPEIVEGPKTDDNAEQFDLNKEMFLEAGWSIESPGLTAFLQEQDAHMHAEFKNWIKNLPPSSTSILLDETPAWFKIQGETSSRRQA